MGTCQNGQQGGKTMSFSSDIKQELNKTNNLANKENVKFELIGYVISGNTTVVKGKNLRFSTESDYNINRFSKLLSNLDIHHDIDISGKTFNIVTKSLDIRNLEFLEIRDNEIFLKPEFEDIKASSNKDMQKDTQKNTRLEESMKAFIRGAFMGAGSINNPENSYHLEIAVSNEENLNFLKKQLENFDIHAKTLITANKFSVYLKEGEEISKLLALIGANKAVMQFEDIRIQKEMRGKVNRIVNCETANLNKTINAAIEQIGAIKKLQKDGRFNKLDDNLKEIAMLRVENPDMSLVELGKLLKKPVGKSGVNYRLKKIVEIANGK